jgi:predicted nucleic acid-binding protein
MILLDTNVVSEPFRKSPSEAVVEWINAQPLETLYLSAITVAELRAGVALLPSGKKRDHLNEGLETRVLPLFAGRVLPFDLSCTMDYAAIVALSRKTGTAIATADGYIAAIAAANGFYVATRDTGPFQAAGVAVINPWSFVRGGKQ